MQDKFFPTRFLYFSAAFASCVIFLSLPASAAIEDHITHTESGFYYTVQKGDTLWDLSREFANSPWVWPEMWRYNPEIKNPHLIYPGQKILVYKKEWEGAEKQAAAPEQKPAEKIQTFHKFTDIDRVGFIREEPMPHLGTIFKSHEDVTLIDKGTLVYIFPEPGAPPLSVGQRYTTFRTAGPIHDPQTDAVIGIQHLLSGAVEITAIEPDFAVARVIVSYRDTLVHDRLMPFEKRDTEILIRESRQGIMGKVIHTEEDELLTAQHYIVFIDKGKNDGIAPGQFYSVYAQESARPEPDKFRSVDLLPFRIGEIIVLHTEKTTATALITKSIQQIQPGHLVRTLEVTGN